MIKAAIYNLETGIIRQFVVSQYSCVDLDCLNGEDFYLNCPVGATHIINNVPVTIIPEPIPPTPEQIQAILANAVQNHLDNTAKTRNYDGILSLCSYDTSTNPRFQAEGQAGVVWRDSCWDYCYQVLADVQAGERPVPTPEELITELPTIAW